MKKKHKNLKNIIIITLIKKDSMENTNFKVEDVFGDGISQDNFSQEQITKLNNFLAKIT